MSRRTAFPVSGIVAVMGLAGASPQPARGDDVPIAVREIGGHENIPRCITFDLSGRFLCAEDGRSLRLWDTGTGAKVWTRRNQEAASVLAVSFRFDGRRLVTSEAIRDGGAHDGAAAGFDGAPIFSGESLPPFRACALKIRDAATGREVRVLAFEDGKHLPQNIAFTHTSTVVVLYRGLRLKGWDTQTGKELFAVDGRKAQENCSVESPDVYIEHLAVGGDARVVAFTRHDNRSGGDDRWIAPLGGGKPRSIDAFLRIWDVSANRIRALSNGTRAIQTIAITRDGKCVATGDVDHRLTLWDTASMRVLRTFKAETDDNPMILAFNPTGSRILSATGDGYFREWDCGSGRQLRTIRGPKASVRAIAFLPDRLRVAAGADGSEHDPKTGKQVVAPLLIWDADIFPNP